MERFCGNKEESKKSVSVDALFVLTKFCVGLDKPTSDIIDLF